MRGAKRVTVVMATALVLPSVAAWTQTYPAKPVRYVIPSAAGTGNDIVGRLLADRLTRLWGQQVIADNRVGASGIVASTYVAKAPADGYTLYQCNISPNAIAYATQASLSYEARDFAPVTRIGMTPNIITVHPSTPFKSLKDLAAHARANPGKLSYSTVLAGTSTHLAMESIKRRLKFDIVHVPYKSPVQGTSDVVAGMLPVNITNFPAAIPYVQDGRLRALAVTSAQRQAPLSQVPTVQESGVPGYSVYAWSGVCTPAGVPAALLDKLNADITAALRTPDLERRLNEVAMPPMPTTRDAFEQFMRDEIARWARVVSEIGMPKQ